VGGRPFFPGGFSADAVLLDPALSMRPPAALIGAAVGRAVGGDEALVGEGGEGVAGDLEGAFEGAGGG
jgi:hypothetical protein